MTPDFSPAMLKLFLRGGAMNARENGTGGSPVTTKRFLSALRKRARVTNFEMHSAWMGRLLSAAPRLKLWRALGHDPASHGVTLTHGGQEHA